MVKKSNKKAVKKTAKKKAAKIAVITSAKPDTQRNLLFDAFEKNRAVFNKQNEATAAIKEKNSKPAKVIKEYNHTEEHNALPLSKLPLFLQINLKEAEKAKGKKLKKVKRKKIK